MNKFANIDIWQNDSQNDSQKDLEFGLAYGNYL